MSIPYKTVANVPGLVSASEYMDKLYDCNWVITLLEFVPVESDVDSVSSVLPVQRFFSPVY